MSHLFLDRRCMIFLLPNFLILSYVDNRIKQHEDKLGLKHLTWKYIWRDLMNERIWNNKQATTINYQVAAWWWRAFNDDQRFKLEVVQPIADPGLHFRGVTNCAWPSIKLKKNGNFLKRCKIEV